ncbi:hypothetical protein ABIF35_006558 [Bradyrhizobium japonicum]|uniref:hypothetical protein n=1 Tax=Bradyrhizobium diazoefficiens TaxID=1355477 RepID=UPI00347A9C86
MVCSVSSRPTQFLFATLIASLVLASSQIASADDQDLAVKLSKDEAELLKQVLGKDEFLKNLSASQKGLSDLNQLLGKTITGPVTLAIKWNQALIDGWGKANSALVKISKSVTCDQLLEPIVDSSPNSSFFEKLRKARECD